MISKFASLLLVAATAFAWTPLASAQAQPTPASVSRNTPMPLEWTPNPGAFEQNLRRRYGNPLYAPSRRRVTRSELKSAIIRDADEARGVLNDFMNLALQQRKLSYLDEPSEIDAAVATFERQIRWARGVGGEASKLADELQSIRAELIASWRKRNKDSRAVQVELDEIEASLARRAPLENSDFIAQMLRKNSPIASNDLASAMLGEDVRTIRVAMRQLGTQRQQAVRREALAVVSYVRLEGAEIDGFDERFEALTGQGRPASGN